tara:strand:- start:399 stop:1145 length:747 start_codon:yes stop_codon:yes gene_type:complete
MDFLRKRNPHPRDERITFEEGPHIYTIDGVSDYTSATTVVHAHFSTFDADKIITKMQNGRRWIVSKYFGMTREEIKAQWENNRSSAAAAGTKMHLDIEKFYNNIPVENDSIEYKYFKNFIQSIPNLTPYRTEWMVFDTSLKLAGSIDMVYEQEDGTLLIYDWKRSKEIKKSNRWQSSTNKYLAHVPDSNFWHYSLQLNIYKYLLETNYGKTVAGMFLVCLHPNNQNQSFQRLEVPTMAAEVVNIIQSM